MGYLHIDNLYKYPNIFMFKEVYGLEKIHGTSAHVAWKDQKLRFFSGGVKFEPFVLLFRGEEPDTLEEAFRALGHEDTEITVYGEAYGGKCQGMSDVYGKDLRFVVFDVKIGDTWLSVPNARDVAQKLGLEFVACGKVPATVEALTKMRDCPSMQAKRNGIEEPQQQEGIVIRPLIELKDSRGNRIICKYKTENFRETKTPRPVDAGKLEVLRRAEAIADEWVTPMRLEHVLQKLAATQQIASVHDCLVLDMKDIPKVIKAMQEDVKREAGEEVEWTKTAARAVGSAAAKLYKKKVQTVTEGVQEWPRN